jgi:acyl-CoA hydrolase
MEYFDMHLSQVAPMAWQGFLGPLDTAVIEITGIRPDGALIPSSSVGNNKTWLDRAQQVILEVNSWQNAALEGMHDIYYGTALLPARVPIPLVRPDDRIGEPYLRCDPDKIVGIVETDAADRNLPFAPPDVGARRHLRKRQRRRHREALQNLAPLDLHHVLPPCSIDPAFLSLDSPDDSRTSVNIGAFPGSLQDRRDIPTGLLATTNPPSTAQ